jgi:MtrB/PioB family decaheme-associated outer membrane protein
MKNQNQKFVVRALTVAVQSALAVMVSSSLSAYAQSDVVKELKQPDNFIEAGIVSVDKASGKFGEYSGLRKAKTNVIADFRVQGGDSFEGTGKGRYEVHGNDLGTQSGDVGASVGEQGLWSLTFGYDELTHTLSDSFQTPYSGSVGGNVFTLPKSFGYIDTTKTSLTPTGNGLVPGAPWAAGTRNLTAAQQAAFHTETVGTTRRTTSFGASVEVDSRLNIQFELSSLKQTGAKVQGMMTQGYSPVAVPSTTAGTATWKNQGSVQTLSPTNYDTYSLTTSVNWVGEKAWASVGYFGSFFKDNYNGFTYDNPMAGATATATLSQNAACVAGTGACYATNTLSTAPSNDFHQLNVSGGYKFSPKTKLSGGFSFGRNTQNESFINDPMMASNPSGSSMNGLVETKNANLKLIDQSFKDWVLSASWKYNERNNKTVSNLYKFYSANVSSITGTTQAAGLQSVVNAPFSNIKSQYELAGDYRISAGNSLRTAYERETLERFCSNVAANAAPYPNPAGNTPAMPAGADCVLAKTSGEDKLGITYRNTMVEDVRFDVGYAYANRKTDYNPFYFNPILTINNTEYVGFRPVFEASRTQDILKASVSWQMSEKLSLSGNGKYSQDKYPDSTFGMQDGSTTALNLDANYAYSDNGAVSAYISWQERNAANRLTNTGAKSPLVPAVAATPYRDVQKDVDNTIGLNVTQKGLMAGKLVMSGDLSYSLVTTDQKVEDAGYNTGKTTNACQLSNVLFCGAYPQVKNELVQFKLMGTYSIDKKSQVAVSYVYQQLSSNDYLYNGYQYGYTPSAQLPSNEVTPNYTVNMVGVSYQYNF